MIGEPMSKVGLIRLVFANGCAHLNHKSTARNAKCKVGGTVLLRALGAVDVV